MTPSILSADSPDYPAAARQLFGRRPPSITALGDLKLLQSGPRAIFCSVYHGGCGKDPLLAFGIKPLQPSDVHPRRASTQADRYSKK
jgi:hypothetical protein